MLEEKFKFYSVSENRMFKLFFGTQMNIEFLQDLLESYFDLEEGSLKEIEILNPIIIGESIMKRNYELDVKVKLPDGTLIDIEMQNAYDNIAEKKSLIYLSKIFSEQLYKNEDINNVKDALSLIFTRKLVIRKSNEVIQEIFMKNNDILDDILLKDLFKMSIVNVESKCEYLKNKRFENWIKFIRCNTLEEQDAVSKLSLKMKSAVERSRELMSNKFVSTLYIQEAFERAEREKYENGKKEFENDKKELENDKKEFENEKQEFQKDKQEFQKDKQEFQKDIEKLKNDKQDFENKKREFQNNKEKLQNDKREIENNKRKLQVRESHINELITNASNDSYIKGTEQGKIEIAKNLLLNTNNDLETISICTNLPLCKIKKLSKELNSLLKLK